TTWRPVPTTPKPARSNRRARQPRREATRFPDIADPGGPRVLGSRKFKAHKEGTLPLVLPLSTINPMQYMDRRTLLCAIAVTVLAAASRAAAGRAAPGPLEIPIGPGPAPARV